MRLLLFRAGSRVGIRTSRINFLFYSGPDLYHGATSRNVDLLKLICRWVLCHKPFGISIIRQVSYSQCVPRSSLSQLFAGRPSYPQMLFPPENAYVRLLLAALEGSSDIWWQCALLSRLLPATVHARGTQTYTLENHQFWCT
jgi:hypothetical protein